MTVDVRTDVRELRHWIDGASIGEPSIERLSPATNRLIAVVADATQADVDAAVAAANRAFGTASWQQTTHTDRASLLERFADAIDLEIPTLAYFDSQEVGKPLAFAEGDLRAGVAHIRQAAAVARTFTGEQFPGVAHGYLAMSQRRPAGVAAIIIPWNFPALILFQKLPYALAAGCTVVVKPSELTTSSALRIAEIAHSVGFPSGTINVVTGYGHTAGQMLSSHAGINYVSFTGSTRTGRLVAQAAGKNLTRAGLELGGKTANVVFPDANLTEAIRGTVFGAFANQGESCVATSRLLLHESIAETFVDGVVEATERLRVGLPDDPTSDLGSLIHHGHRDQVARAVTDAVAAGARVRTGGGRPQSSQLDAGAFYEPTVVVDVDPESALFTEEVFGPVLAVTTFETEEEAIEMTNATRYGLAHSLWTQDLNRALRVGQRLEAGTVWVNTCSDGSPQVAFGGVKASGYGRDAASEGFNEFTEYCTMHVRSSVRSSPFDHE